MMWWEGVGGCVEENAIRYFSFSLSTDIESKNIYQNIANKGSLPLYFFGVKKKAKILTLFFKKHKFIYTEKSVTNYIMFKSKL